MHMFMEKYSNCYVGNIVGFFNPSIGMAILRRLTFEQVKTDNLLWKGRKGK